ncbi:MAG: hypothetical protein HY645_04560 [Acidobacteria bacterium]|nr:hypothetical protein [Acidobacteriota bacterium]
MKIKTKAVLYLSGVFISGLLLGMVIGIYTERSTDASPPLSFTEYHGKSQVVAKLRAELDLNDQQVASIEKIVDSCRQRFLALRDDFKPLSDRLVSKMNADIRAILTSEQRERFDKFLDREFRKRR